MLLEVVISVGILAMGMAFVGMQIQNASRLEWESERALRGLLLAEQTMAELDSGFIQYEEEIEKEFGPIFPDYAWRLSVEQTSIPELNLVKLEVLHQVRQSVDETFDYDTATPVHTLYTMRATPTRLDLTRDFGMDEERADQLTEQLANVGGGGIDPRDLDPALFKNMTMEELLEVAPALLEAFGMSLDDVKRMLPPELLEALEEAEAELEESRDGAETDDAAKPPESGGGAVVPSGRHDSGGGQRGGERQEGEEGDPDETGQGDEAEPPSAPPPRRGGRPAPVKGDSGGRKPPRSGGSPS